MVSGLGERGEGVRAGRIADAHPQYRGLGMLALHAEGHREHQGVVLRIGGVGIVVVVACVIGVAGQHQGVRVFAAPCTPGGVGHGNRCQLLTEPGAGHGPRGDLGPERLALAVVEQDRGVVQEPGYTEQAPRAVLGSCHVGHSGEAQRAIGDSDGLAGNDIVHDLMVVHDAEGIGLGDSVSVDAQNAVVRLQPMGGRGGYERGVGQGRNAVARGPSTMDLIQRNVPLGEVEAIHRLPVCSRDEAGETECERECAACDGSVRGSRAEARAGAWRLGQRASGDRDRVSGAGGRRPGMEGVHDDPHGDGQYASSGWRPERGSWRSAQNASPADGLTMSRAPGGGKRPTWECVGG
jgi:hypothetical protein